MKVLFCNKRILSMFLVIVLAIGMIPSSTFAAIALDAQTSGDTSVLENSGTPENDMNQNSTPTGGELAGTTGTAVAKIGDTEYATLAEAITAAQADDTIVLLDNITTSETFTISKKTIDLNGKTLTIAEGKAINVNGGQLVINNGTVVGSIVMNTSGDSVVTSDKNLNVSISEALAAKGYKVVYDEENGYYCVDLPMPDAIINDIKNELTEDDPELTFALNFAFPDNLTQAYIEELFAVYGNWYVDYVITISGLNSESVTFNADGNADGYLAGQYDAWSEYWVTVPFENVTINNNGSLFIMQTAAEMLGQNGLRFTLAEIAEIVTNFNCGVYFTPEFLAANPDLEVSLELRVFAEKETHGFDYVISVAKNNFENVVVEVDGVGYASFEAAIEYLKSNVAHEIILKQDISSPASTLVLHNWKNGESSYEVTIDLNGYNLNINSIEAKSGLKLNIIDGTTDKSGSLTVNRSIVGEARNTIAIGTGVNFNGVIQINNTKNQTHPGTIILGDKEFIGTNGIFSINQEYTVYLNIGVEHPEVSVTISTGYIVLNRDYTLASGCTLNAGTAGIIEIPAGVTLTVVEGANLGIIANSSSRGTIKGDGTIKVATLDQLKVALASDIKNIEIAGVIDAGDYVVDLNGKTLKGTVLGTVSVNNGLWITAEGFKLIGTGADYYTTTDAVVKVAANGITIVEGTVSLKQNWRTLPGQNITVGANAKFEIPAGKTFTIYDNTSVVVEGTLTVNGKILLNKGATLTAPEGLNIEVAEGMKFVYENGVYKVIAFNPIVEVNGVQYETLAAAIKAAKTDDTIILLKDVTEDVTFNKNITIDGGDFKYTGTIKISGDADVTIQNVNFVKGYIEQNGTTTSATLTVKGCSFANGGYAITTERIKNLIVEECAVTNQSLLYAKLTTSYITVKDVTISKGNYLAYICYCTEAYFENVIATDMNYFGICAQNNGSKTITINNCYIEAPVYAIASQDVTTSVDTFVFVGDNTVNKVYDNQYNKLVLAKGATLEAPAGLEISTEVGYTVKYDGVKYYTKACVVAIGEETYASISEALTVAKDGDTITFLQDITENVTINKSVTIEGKKSETENFQYTGKMTIAVSDANVTIQNVKFTKGHILSDKDTSKGTTLKISNCEFDGQNSIGHAMEIANFKQLIIEGGTIKNYKLSAVYVKSAQDNDVIINSTTIESIGSYAIRIAYGEGLNLNGVTIKNVYGGVLADTAKNYTFTNCTFENVTLPLTSWSYTLTGKFIFNETNTIPNLSTSNGGTFVLSVGATLVADAGLDIAFNGDASYGRVEYAEGKYFVHIHVRLERHDNEYAPTCTVDGYYELVVYCECGHEFSRNQVTISALGHTAGEVQIENRVEATCDSDGAYHKVTYCTVCDAEIKREHATISALGHTAGEAKKENEVGATCTEKGYYEKIVYCSVCNEVLSREVVYTSDAHNHKITMSMDPATGFGIKFYFDACDSVGYINIGGTEIERDNWTTVSEGYYYVEYNEISAKDFADAINVQLIGDNMVVAGIETSVEAYAKAELARKDITIAYANLLNAMLKYGAAAKAYLNEVYSDKTVSDEIPYDDAYDISGDYKHLADISVSGQSLVTIKFLFDFRGVENVTIDKNMFTINSGLKYEAIENQSKPGVWMVSVEVPAYCMSEAITCKANVAGHEVSVTYSVETYAFEAYRFEDLNYRCDLVDAMMAYGNAAKAFAPKN